MTLKPLPLNKTHPPSHPHLLRPLHPHSPGLVLPGAAGPSQLVKPETRDLYTKSHSVPLPDYIGGVVLIPPTFLLWSLLPKRYWNRTYLSVPVSPTSPYRYVPSTLPKWRHVLSILPQLSFTLLYPVGRNLHIHNICRIYIHNVWGWSCPLRSPSCPKLPFSAI